MRVLPLSLTVIILTCTLVQAEVLEFPLPNITGGLSTYQDSVLYAGDTLQVLSVRLVVAAVIDDLGYQICPTAPPQPAEVCDLGFLFNGIVWKNRDSDVAYGPKGYSEQTETGDYEKTILWSSGGFTDLVFGDVIRVGFSIYKHLNCCSPPVETSDPVVTLTSVTLIIEASDQVPVEQTTWGRIKSLYGHE